MRGDVQIYFRINLYIYIYTEKYIHTYHASGISHSVLIRQPMQGLDDVATETYRFIGTAMALLQEFCCYGLASCAGSHTTV